FPRGVSSFGIPVIGAGPIVTTGTVFFVDDSGSNNNSGLDPSQPFATLAYAESQCTAGVGDTIVLMPGHAETITTAITVDVGCVHIIGLGHGAQRPNLTVGVAGDIISVTADDVTIENIYFTGHATTAATSFINVNADDVTIRNCHFQALAKPTECMTVVTGSDYLTVEGCRFVGSAAGAAAGIVFEGGGSVKDPIIKGCVFNYDSSAGCDNAAIFISESNTTGVLIQDNVCMGLDDGDYFIQLSGPATTGLALNNYIEHADSTDWILATDGLGVIGSFACGPGERQDASTPRPSLMPSGTQAY
ncbi:MAG: hypothetical protein ACXABY_18315, partial [Candidatus Thorarchaeota archaeon]